MKLLTLDEAMPIWNRLQSEFPGRVPFSTYSWYKAWVLTYGKDQIPYVLYKNKTIVPFVRDGETVRFYSTSTDYNDIIGEANCWADILEFIKADGVKYLELEKVPQDSQTITFFKSYLQENIGAGELVEFKTAPYFKFEGIFDEYLMGIQKTKRKYFRKFEREHPSIKVEESKDVEKDIETLIQLMDSIPKKLQTNTPVRKSFFRQALLSSKEFMNLLLLRYEEDVIGARVIFTQGKEVMFYISGVNLNSFPNAGTYFLIATIRRYMEQGYNHFNFLSGNEQYKYELGASDFPLYKVRVAL